MSFCNFSPYKMAQDTGFTPQSCCHFTFQSDVMKSSCLTSSLSVLSAPVVELSIPLNLAVLPVISILSLLLLVLIILA